MGAVVALHIASAAAVLALSVVQLWRRGGGGAHRVLGYAWTVAILTAAITSFWITQITPGAFSFVHALSVLIIISTLWAIWAARSGKLRAHRRVTQWISLGAAIAFVFTLAPDRMLGRMLWAMF